LVDYARFAWLGTFKTRAFAWADVMVMRGLSLSVIGLAAVSKSQIGIYKVSWTVASMLALLSVSITQSLFPEYSELSVSDDFDEVRHLLNEGLTFAGLFLIPGLFGALLVGDTILTVFGPEFEAGGAILVILVCARLFSAYGSQFLNTINAVDYPDVAFRVNLAYIGGNIFFNLVLVTLFGWYGAAVATALASLLNILIAGYALTNIIGHIPVPSGELGRQIVSSTGMLGVIFGIQQLIPDTLGWTLATVAVGASVYFMFLLLISERTRQKTRGVIPLLY
jgi:O-antigen/teichoic acid export membrane protein